jgi:hypothetical protein
MVLHLAHAVHSFEFVPATSSPSLRPLIKVTNGPTGAAFIGFYKGYYGGENSDPVNPPNGGITTNQYEVMSYANTGGTKTLTFLWIYLQPMMAQPHGQ